MHISLDAALQRQPLLSTVGDKLLPSFPGAAAAYSLRALNGDANNVVNVRRDGDDGERDFTAEGVALELENWVNGKLETTLPADVATAAAAYSLRKVRNAYTGNAVQIRRASDDVEVNVAFDSNGEVSTSSAISNVEDLELVSESGFATDTGGFESSISGANFTFGNTLDGKDNVLFATFDGAGLLGLNFSTSDVAIGDVVKYSFEVYWASTNVGGLPNLRIRSGNTNIGHTDVPMPSEDSWYTFSGQFTVTSNTPTALTFIAADSSGLTTGDVFAIANGSYDKQQDAGDTTATTLGEFLAEATPARNRTGPARYDTFTPDGVTGFTAITNNIAAGGFDIAGASGAEVQVSFDITLNSGTVTVSLRPAFETGSDVSNSETITTSGSKSFTLTATGDYKAMLFITASADYVISNFSVNVPYNHDATVVTWYDQSGNGYDLTQPTTGNQPKMAENGSLLTLAGKATIKPDGSDDFLINENAAWNTINNPELSCMTVAEGTSLTNRILWGIGSSGGEDTDWLIGGAGSVGNVEFRGNRITSGAMSAGTSGAFLLTGLDVTGGDGYINGVASGSPVSATRNVTADRLVLFTRRGSSSLGTCTDQSISEIIFYSSDQSDNRFKIESNINNYYGIYTAAYNGFVETWYDQSGNGNHAEQTASDEQPKIVSAGSLLADGIDFDGVDDHLEPNGLNATFRNIGNAFIFSAYSHDSAGSGTETLFYANAGNGLGVARVFLGSVSSNESAAGRRLDTDNFTQSTTAKSSGLKLRSANFNWSGGDVQLFENGVESTATAFSSGSGLTSDTDNSPVRIGRLGGASSYLNGNIKELIIYDSDQSANRTAIESNIADEYGITLS